MIKGRTRNVCKTEIFFADLPMKRTANASQEMHFTQSY